MKGSAFSGIDAVANAGKAVMAGGDEAVVEVVKAAIRADISVSFYLTKAQTQAVRDWYWTPERVRLTGLREVSAEESDRIRSELELDLSGFRYAPIACECGQTYGAFDFLRQGIEQHGLEAVRSVFALKNATLFQVNPTFIPLCTNCRQSLGDNMMARGGGWYDCDQYGGCCCCADIAFPGAMDERIARDDAGDRRPDDGRPGSG